MPLPLIVSIVGLIVSIIMIIIGADNDNDDIWGDEILGLGISVLVIDLLCGFLLCCNVATIRTESSILIPDEIAKSQYTLYTKCDGQSLSSTEARFVMASNDTIRVKKTLHINSYGGVASTSYNLEVMESGK